MRHKLRTHPDSPRLPTPPRVDRSGNGRINGLSLATKGPALGHGFDLDDKTIDQVRDLAGGAKGRWTHGNLCADGLGTHLGRVDRETIRRDGDHAVGDFVFSKQAHKFVPEGLTQSAAEFLMDAAENEPDTLGMSIVFEGEIEESETPSGMVARLDAVPRVDFVGDPGANPFGLFAGTGSELSASATHQLDEFIDEIGQDRVVEFTLNYLATKGVNLMKKPQDAPSASEPVELSQVSTELADTKAKLEKALKELREHKQAEIDTYIASLSSDSTDANAPIDKVDLDTVQELLEHGADDIARKLGAALLKTAKLTGGEDFERDEADPVTANKTKSDRATARLLRAQKWTVEVDEKTGRILKSTPPGKE